MLDNTDEEKNLRDLKIFESNRLQHFKKKN
jgi:hypothetical protein